MNERIDDITIVGGGSAGWLMGLFLTTMLNKGESKVKVTLIESPNIPTIGVGEGTVTGFPRMLQQLGIKESEFLRNSDATFKCAGKFVGWNLDAKGKPTTFYRCQPWRAKRRLVVPGSREAALLTRRALRQRGSKVGK
ncbi:MAG: tryptophan 7-halogenase, partial [gamma proteobacterium endosymbiont of Lamellibrachia anaximandri]|nr:tryptophan 7-halogenase [gamma proteobacterium endosymbiont of Lamellibrachia anaximandri]